MFRHGKIVVGKLQVGGGNGDRSSPQEPLYEEVGPPIQLKKKTTQANNQNGTSTQGPGKSEVRPKNCDLCGSTEAAVRCERCQSQAFCLACDEMYHRHPRRASHVRKSVESTGSGNMRPPLPPKVDTQGAPPPQPPPRKNKGRIFMPGTNSKEQDAGTSGGRGIMGSLKRFMGSRPLPPVPDQAKGRSTPAPSHPGPSQNSMARRNTSPNINLTSEQEGVVTVNMSGGPVPGLLLPGEVPDNDAPSAVDPNSQYTPVGPKTGQPKPPQQHHNTNSLGRKFSLQQNNTSLSTSRSSMVDPSSGGGGGGWETDSATRSANISNLRQKSQSISDDQWAQVMSTQDGGGTQGWGPMPGYPDQGQQGRGGRCNTMGRSAGGQSRGMVSSASVCDLNTLSQQQQQPPQNNFANPHMAGSFQQLNMMGMVPWGAPPPAPCDACCQGAPMNYPGHQHGGGMRRAGSNLSMNLSSVGSNEMPGYPWPPPAHMHPHHMPIAYPGYYPGYPPQMVPPPGSMSSSTGLNISIPDSMNTFGKVPSSPVASVRSSSHRSHKSSKSRSFSAADGRRSRGYSKKRSEESEDSYSSSYSDEDEINERVSKTGYRAGGTLSWQCDHCTFINSGGTRTCGMCSKSQGSGKSSNNRSKSRNNDRSQRSHSRKQGSRRTDHDDDPDISDYDNDEVLKSNFTFNIRDNKKESRSKSSASNKTKSRKKSRKSVGRSHAGSPDSSPSGSEEEVQLERQMKDLRVSSARKQNGDYDGYTKKEKERSSHKKEGGNGRFKNRGRASSERSRTPVPQISKQSSPEHSDDDDQLHDNQVVKWAGPDNERLEPSNNQLELIESESQSQKNSREDTLQNEHVSIVENNETQTPVPNIAIEDKIIIYKPERPKSLQLPILETNVYNDLKKAESINLVLDKTPSPKLSPLRNDSPPNSNRTSRDADDPSFANTLDEITSMGTEEVDYVPSSRYVDHDINLDNIDNINGFGGVIHDTPVAYFPGNAIQNNQLDNSKLDEADIKLIEQIHNNNMITEEIPEVILSQPEENIEVINLKPVMDQEPTYELIDEPKQEDEGTMVENAPKHSGNTMEMLNNEVNIPIDIPKIEGAERTNIQPIEEIRKISREGSRELIHTPSSSVGSLPADPGQYTPLSYSSSDAFYSPPNSPDVSLTDRLEDKPSASQTQDSNTLLGSSSGGGFMPEEELVTALESVHNDKENYVLNASRETIRDSVEQLPYTDEEVAAVAAGDRPVSTGAEVPVAKPLLSPTTPSDGYESLSFQDAVSDTHLLQRSLSDKGIASSSKVVPTRHSVAPSDEEIAALEQARQQAFMQEMGQAVGSKQLMTVEDIIKKRKQDALEKQGLEVVRQLREAEAAGYTAEELSIAMNQCGDKDPVEWLKENWVHMVDTVITLATNYEQQRTLSDIETISVDEAGSALRLLKGNIWEAVTECLNKRNKVDDLQNLPTASGSGINKKELDVNDDYDFIDAEDYLPADDHMNMNISTVDTQNNILDGTLSEHSSLYSSVNLNNKENQNYNVTSSVEKKLSKIEDTKNNENDISEIKEGRLYISVKSFDKTLVISSDENIGRKQENNPSKNKTNHEKVRNREVSSITVNKSSLHNELDLSKINEYGDIDFMDAEDELPVYSNVSSKIFGAENQYSDFDNTYSEPGSAYSEMNILHTTNKEEIQTKDVKLNVDEEDDKDNRIKDDIDYKAYEKYKASSKIKNIKKAKKVKSINQDITKDDDSTQTKGEFIGDLNPSGDLTVAKVINENEGKRKKLKKKSTRDSKTYGDVSETKDEYENTSPTKVKKTKKKTKNTKTLTDISDQKQDAKKEVKRYKSELMIYTDQTGRISDTNTYEASNYDDMLLSDADEPSEELAALTDKHPAGAEEDATIDKNEEIIKLQQNDGSNSEIEDAAYYENNTMQVMQQEVSQQDYYDSVSIKDVVVPQTPSGTETNKTEEYIEPPASPQVKASAIVGHAIAKAMAREPSSRLSGSRSVTPEVNSSISSRDPTSSSRDPTPISRDPTPDQPIAITPDPITEEDSTLQVTVTDSEEDDLLRTLDTIPEEEEISEMTDTGKISRSSSRLIRKKKAEQITTDEGSTVINQEASTSNITPILEIHDEEPIKNTSTPSQINQDAIAGTSSNGPHVSNSNMNQTISSPSVGGAYSILPYGSSSAITVTKTTIDVATASSSVVESSGEPDGEAVSRRMIPGLLGQVEGLKARGDEADYAEVHELKEQISSMRKHLEEKMQQGENLTEEEDGARPSSGATTVTDDDEQQQLPGSQQQPAPTITVQQPPQDDQTPQEENKQFDFDRTVRRLLAEGQAASYEKAELAAQLMTFNFDEKDSIDAAEDCSSMYTAIKFLQQECELCAEKYPMKKMVSMLMCTHHCCFDCAKTYFTFQIKTKNVREIRCPFCNEPDLDADEDIANEYLNNLDILLKNILDDETHGLFQRKLRDWTLMKDPNFKWCSKCSSGFISNPRARKLICPDCKDVTCQSCRKEWEAEHENMNCEEFGKWKDENELEAGGVNKHIAEYGITCPKCKFKFSLAKGGCMHFTCSQCKYEFCSGCLQPFRQGKKCPVGPYCERLGLHAHHPRNCLFYLRDKDPNQLQQLLKDRSITYNTEVPEGYEAAKSEGGWKQCQVLEQKELPEGLIDDICGRIVTDGFAGLCRLHYTEYLVDIINEQKLDPVNIFDEADLRVCLRRNGKTVPIRRWESEKLYRDKLIKLIKEQLPLDV